MEFVLAPYPLSASYRARLREVVGGDPHTYSIGELRRLGPRALVSTLRRERGNACVIALEDDASRPLLSVLGALAVGAGARSIDVVDPTLRRSPLPRSRALEGLAGVAAATAQGAAALRRARRTVQALLESERQDVRLAADRRVLYLNAQLWYGVTAGGSVAHVSGVVNALSDLGYEVTYASLGDPVGLRDGVRFARLPSLTTFGLPPEINYVRLQSAVVREAVALGRARAPSLLYQRLAVSGFAGPLVARELRIPYVLEYNGSEVWIARNWGRPLRYDRLALTAEEASLRHAHLVVTVSDVLRDELVARGVHPDRIVAYPNGVDPQPFDTSTRDPDERAALRRQLGLADDAFVVGFIGTFGEWHGVDVLARAIRKIADGHRGWADARRVRFLLIGDGLRMGEVRETLGDLAGDLAVLTGLVPQESAPAYLLAADALVSPHVQNRDSTRFFGSPTKLFEYMATGRPIIASDLEQLGDILRPALDTRPFPDADPKPEAPELAVLTRPGDVEDLVEAIRFIAERPRWGEQLGANARRRVLERHTWAHHVNEILAGLERVV